MRQESQDDVIKLAKFVGVQKAIIYFPYNQHGLLVPNKQFWMTFTDQEAILFVSPNTIIESAPRSNLVVLTKNEMTLDYLQEIKGYISMLDNLRHIRIIASDIHIPRIKRDLKLVLDNKLDFDIEYIEIKLPNSFWKLVYSLRELLIRSLPMRIYKKLASKQQVKE
ncbi:MAG: hypothetical protein ACP5RX_00110 [Minisyncoccia bacterium]